MARTPRTRGGSKAEPRTPEPVAEGIPEGETPAVESAPAEFAASESLSPEAPIEREASEQGVPDAELPLQRAPSDDATTLAEPPAFPDATAPEPAEASGFAASESLTPGENAALAEPPATDSAAPAFSEGTDAESPPETPQAPDAFRSADRFEFTTEEPMREDVQPSTASNDASATEMEGPGIAATPVPSYVETASPETDSSEPAARSERPSETQPVSPYAAPSALERRGRGGLFAAGLLGGVAALLLAGLLQYLGFLPAAGSANAGGANTQAFQSEIDGLKAEVASLRQAGSQAGTGAADPALASEVDALKTEVAQLKSAGGATAAVPPELESRLAAAEQKLSGLGEGVSAEQLATVSDKAGAAETLARQNDGALKDAAARVATLEQNFSGVQGTVSGLQASVGELQTGVEALQAQPRVAMAIAASALKQASDRGAPFTAELATLGTLAPNAPEIAQLQPYAESGVPTRQALQAEWNASVDAVLATENPPAENAGLMSRLLSGAGSLVSVRPIGAVEGPGTAATVGRVQAALEAGDLEKALAEFDTLPEAAKGAAAGFAEKARARLAVESLVNGAIANAAKAA